MLSLLILRVVAFMYDGLDVVVVVDMCLLSDIVVCANVVMTDVEVVMYNVVVVDADCDADYEYGDGVVSVVCVDDVVTGNADVLVSMRDCV